MHVAFDFREIALCGDTLGAIGAALLYKGSFAYEAFTPYVDAAGKMVEEMKQRNRRRQATQRCGFALILVSFVLQAASAILG
jgi:hypothetical protein